MQILITGASGYIGQHLSHTLAAAHNIAGVSLRATEPAQLPLQVTDTVIHLSGIVHQPDASEALHQQINTDQTITLAQQARDAGVRHFIFFSSVAVYGGHGSLQPGAALNEQSPCQPDSPYGRSKLAAEQALLAMADADFTVAIVRPPMVYGPGCPGNMARLQRLVARLPALPLGWQHNRRSLVAIDNLIAMTRCILEQQASGIFLPQDPEPLSIQQLSQLLADAQQRRRWLFSPSRPLLLLAQRLRPRLINSLYGNFQLDNRHSLEQLDFTPPLSSREAITRMCEMGSNVS